MTNILLCANYYILYFLITYLKIVKLRLIGWKNVGFTTFNPSHTGNGYFIQTGSIPCLLMTWLMMSPGHQQTWYWLHNISSILSYTRVNFTNIDYFNDENWYKMQFDICIPSKQFSMKRVNITTSWKRNAPLQLLLSNLLNPHAEMH